MFQRGRTIQEYLKARIDDLELSKKSKDMRIEELGDEIDIVSAERYMISSRIEELEEALKYFNISEPVVREPVVREPDYKAATYAELASQLSHKAYIGIDLAQGFDMPPENRKGVVK